VEKNTFAVARMRHAYCREVFSHRLNIDRDATPQLSTNAVMLDSKTTYDITMFALPPATQALILTNVIVFFAESMMGVDLAALALWPLGPSFMPWQVLTYAFVHGNLTHLLFNMFGLYMFGSEVERVWGSARFLKYYLICALSGAVAQILFSMFSATRAPMVGASASIFGLLIAFARLYPNRMVIPLFPPIPMRAPVFVAVYGGLELLLGVTGTAAGVAHFAHLGGLAGGYLYLKFGHR
jgi:membrane associated rhomboid family serine protease